MDPITAFLIGFVGSMGTMYVLAKKKVWKPNPEESTNFIIFWEAYLEAALWTQGLSKRYTIAGFSEEADAEATRDCKAFIRQAKEYIGDNYAQAGHDFWLTRTGEGAGFWDGDWPEPAATKLTELSKKFGEVWVYVGDDDEIYFTR